MRLFGSSAQLVRGFGGEARVVQLTETLAAVKDV